jgi:hypothetical protein
MSLNPVWTIQKDPVSVRKIVNINLRKDPVNIKDPATLVASCLKLLFKMLSLFLAPL